MRTMMMGILLMTPSWAGDSDDLVKAIELPAQAERLRKAGIEPGQMREALKAAKDADLGADEAEVLLEEEEKAVKEHGPVDNFGKFVQERLREGLRGKELAKAIREEHRERGKGGKGKGKGPDGEKGGKGKGPDGEKGGKGKGHDGEKGHGKDKEKGKEKGKDGKNEKGEGKGKGKGKGGKGKNQ